MQRRSLGRARLGNDPDKGHRGSRSFFADPATNPHPGGESYSDVLNRAEPTLKQLAERHQGENIVVVAHNMLNRVILTPLLGLSLRMARQVKQANCCINVIEWTTDRAELITLNSVLHLD